MELSDSVIEHKDTAYVQFTIPDETGTETQKMFVKDAQIREVNGNIYYVFKCKVSAANMTASAGGQADGVLLTSLYHVDQSPVRRAIQEAREQHFGDGVKSSEVIGSCFAVAKDEAAEHGNVFRIV